MFYIFTIFFLISILLFISSFKNLDRRNNIPQIIKEMWKTVEFKIYWGLPSLFLFVFFFFIGGGQKPLPVSWTKLLELQLWKMSFVLRLFQPPPATVKWK